VSRRASSIAEAKSGGNATGAAAGAVGGVKKAAVNGAASQVTLVSGGANGTAAVPSTAAGTNGTSHGTAKEGNITTVCSFFFLYFSISRFYLHN
jgi:hypothetical protein